jgi:hypothetical protein
MMTGNEMAKFRSETRNQAKTAGITLWNKRCTKCKKSKQVGGGKNVKIGKVNYFTCAECV